MAARGLVACPKDEDELCFLLAYLNQHLARLGSSPQSHVQPLCRLVEPAVETGQAGAKPLSEF